jgi:biotin carboxyl carrier protein
MDARNPLEQDEAVIAPARGRRWPGLLIALAFAAGVAGLAFAFPERARETASGLLGALTGLFAASKPDPAVDVEKAGPVERVFRPSKEQRAAFEILPVATQVFRPEGSAEGRIALNDDDNVPVVSPYAGRVTKVLVRAGDDVKAGDVLLTLEATDMVQAQNDYQAALNNLQKQQALLKLDQTIAQRQQELFQAHATALKDYQSAQNDVIAAQSDLKTAEAALDAVKNRLRLLGAERGRQSRPGAATGDVRHLHDRHRQGRAVPQHPRRRHRVRGRPHPCLGGPCRRGRGGARRQARPDQRRQRPGGRRVARRRAGRDPRRPVHRPGGHRRQGVLSEDPAR